MLLVTLLVTGDVLVIVELALFRLLSPMNALERLANKAVCFLDFTFAPTVRRDPGVPPGAQGVCTASGAAIFQHSQNVHPKPALGCTRPSGPSGSR